MIIMNRSQQKSFTLIEVLVYIAILATVIVVIFSFLIWAIEINIKTRVMRETLDNARRVMEVIVYEVKEAENIYEPTSIFNAHPGQLSLKTSNHLPTGENSTYIDFYICGTHLCFKKESQDPIVLTSERVEITNLVFRQIITNQIPSVQIDLIINYKDSSGRTEYQASVNLKSAASLRQYQQ
ncbi:hypothetical protein LCGC14_0161450 [marine sediment metagenome]|uniref:Type II secretion system protein n=1 Tax=marine sediment metagenome TaxID=412755 RepID=A0A0F9UVT2_9ZZZZ|nr:type II secretion system protein [Candidatus Nealsonbacteria bacterium]